MTSVNSSVVKKIAKLARLSNNENDNEKLELFQTQLESILSHVSELNQIDTKGIAATDGWRSCGIDDLREDSEVSDQVTYNQVKANIINNFPNKTGNLLVIPGIFENN
jgi:aspartyl/glutamyl-tRNA(Asn/Gln) amidotransferase C subunit